MGKIDDVSFEDRLRVLEAQMSRVERNLSLGEEDYCDEVNGEHIFPKGQEWCLCKKNYQRLKK